MAASTDNRVISVFVDNSRAAMTRSFSEVMAGLPGAMMEIATFIPAGAMGETSLLALVRETGEVATGRFCAG